MRVSNKLEKLGCQPMNKFGGEWGFWSNPEQKLRIATTEFHLLILTESINDGFTNLLINIFLITFSLL